MKHLLKYLLVTVLFPSLVALAIVPGARAVDLGNIWPLGDSVTYGAYHAGGYRDSLFTNLTARGFTFKFVGTLTSNSTKRLSAADQAHHDGHSGWAIANAVDIDGKPRRGLYQGLESWRHSVKAPNTILLMIGINDLNTGYKIDSAPERLEFLIDRLFTYYPHTHILLATLPDADSQNKHRHGATNDLAAAVKHYNSGIVSIVAKHQEMGQDITLVDMHAALTLADLHDGLHPNPEGYVKMADKWADAIVAAAAKPHPASAQMSSTVEAGSNHPKRMIIIGDSTVCNYPAKSDRRGWGMFIQNYFNSNQLQVVNLALSGRSTKTFIREGHWTAALKKKPDYVLIQFGHNDSHSPDHPEATDANTTYQQYLRQYVEESRAIGAKPVLITPMCRRNFKPDGHVVNALLPYANAMKDVAKEEQVPLVDLNTASVKLCNQLGQQACEALACNHKDHTHFSPKGAEEMARLVMEELPEVEPSLKHYEN